MGYSRKNPNWGLEFLDLSFFKGENKLSPLEILQNCVTPLKWAIPEKKQGGEDMEFPRVLKK